MKILFIGDIVGKVGRRMVKEYLLKYIEKYSIDFVIANGENASHGKGLLKSHYQELIDAGVDCVTLGNHYANKPQIRDYIDRVDRLVRPINLLHEFPGEGSIAFDFDGLTIRVTNILGSAMMDEDVNNPYYSLLDCISNDEENTVIHIVDFHAEATGEKICFAHAFDGKVSAILGTHTHVQTHDAHILPNGTGFISDVGMTGYVDGALGFDKDSVVKKVIHGDYSRFEVPDEGRGIFSAVVMEINEITGKCEDIFSIYFVEDK